MMDPTLLIAFAMFFGVPLLLICVAIYAIIEKRKHPDIYSDQDNLGI